MATYYVDGLAAVNGDGSQATPYNAIPSANFSANTWLLKAGSVLTIGSTQHAVASGAAIGKYGTGDDPVIIGNPATALMIFNNTSITISDIRLVRSGAVGGNGIHCGGGSAADITIQRGAIVGFGNGLFADKTQRLTVSGTEIAGCTNGIQASSRDGVDCADWNIDGNNWHDNGTDLYLRIGENSTYTAGAWPRLTINANTFTNSSVTPIQLQSAEKLAYQSVSITAPSTIVRSGGWPAWPLGSKIWLANFDQRANFGQFTISSISGNNLVVSETTLVNEALSGATKFIFLDRDDTKATDLKITGNIISGSGQTPILLDTVTRAVITGNTVTNSILSGVGAAAIELVNVDSAVVSRNFVDGMHTAVFDGMGIMLDLVTRNCTVSRNFIARCYAGTTDNSGAGLAIFSCFSNTFSANVIEACNRGIWIGGYGTASNVVSGTTALRCTIGLRTNSTPLAADNTIINTALIDCATAISEGSAQTKTNVVSGTAASFPVAADGRPYAGSTLLGAGSTSLGIARDFDGRQRRLAPAIGAFDQATLRTGTV